MGSVVYDTPEKIAMFKLDTAITFATYRSHGIMMTSPAKAGIMRSVKSARAAYRLGDAVRTWDQVVVALVKLKEEWTKDGPPDWAQVKC